MSKNICHGDDVEWNILVLYKRVYVIEEKYRQFQLAEQCEHFRIAKSRSQKCMFYAIYSFLIVS